MQEFQGFPLSHEVIRLSGHGFSMACIADVDALFDRLLDKPDSHPDVTDERIPYWAEIWPAAIGLSEYLSLNPSLVMGKKVVEIGCGLGLPGLVAGRLGAEVLLTDYLNEPLELARYNWERNIQQPATVRQLDWRQVEDLPESDLVLASDIAYESRAFPFLRTLIGHYIDKGSVILISEPSRTFAAEFFKSLSLFPGYSNHTIRVVRNHLPVQVNVHQIVPQQA